MSGKLFVVATPIGNLSDISTRVKQSLSDAQLILAEDTRVSIKLLNHLGLKRTMISCHDFNESKRFHVLEEAHRKGENVALISDAGTPLVSDPGYQIVQKAIELGMTIVPIPGPSAALAALVGSGLRSDRFSFEGFLPEKKGDRDKRLAPLRSDERALIFFVAPSNLKVMLQEILEVLGDRPACLARELTKVHEEFWRADLSALLQRAQSSEIRGEFVLVVAGAQAGAAQKASESEATSRLRNLIGGGARLKDAASVLARETGWTSSELYKLGLRLKEADGQ